METTQIPLVKKNNFIKKYFKLILLMLLVIAMTSAVFYFLDRPIYERNKLLEKWHAADDAALKDCREALVKKKEREQTVNDREIEKRIGNSLYTFYFYDGNKIDLKVVDLEKNEVVYDGPNNPYSYFFRYLEGFKITDMVFVTTEDKNYAVFEMPISFEHSQFYLAESVKDQESFELKSIMTKHSPHSLVGWELLDYFPNQELILMLSGVGDGCGGGGTLQLVSVNSGQISDLQSFSSGCMTGDDRYLGYLNGQLYFGEIKEIEDDEGSWKRAFIVKIYKIDPISKTKTYLNIDWTNSELYLDDSWIRYGEDLNVNELRLVKYLDQTDSGSYEVDFYYGFDVETLELRKIYIDKPEN